MVIHEKGKIYTTARPARQHCIRLVSPPRHAASRPGRKSMYNRQRRRQRRHSSLPPTSIWGYRTGALGHIVEIATRRRPRHAAERALNARSGRMFGGRFIDISRWFILDMRNSASCPIGLPPAWRGRIRRLCARVRQAASCQERCTSSRPQASAPGDVVPSSPRRFA